MESVQLYSYEELLDKLQLSNDNYKFIKSFNEPGKFFIKYSGPKVKKPKRVGCFTVDEFDYDLYSSLLDDSVVPLSNIEIFSGHQRNGHCLNTVKLLIDSLSDCYNKLVVSSLLDRSVWEGLINKMISVDSCFKKFYDAFEDLIINLD
jgi:hypothetical protein